MHRNPTEDSERTSKLRREEGSSLNTSAIRGAKYEEMLKTDGYKDLKEFLMNHIEQLDQQRSALGETEYEKFRKLQTELRVIKMVFSIIDSRVREGRNARAALEKKGEHA